MMTNEQFQEFLKILEIKNKKDDDKTIDKNLSQAEIRKRAAKIIFSIAHNGE